MTLVERMQTALTEAIRNRDELRRETLRMAVASAYNAEKAARRPLTEDEVLTVLTREVKTRRESVDAYTRAGRMELAAKEEAEVAILAEFMPARLSEDEVRELVRAAITESGASSARDLGRVMSLVTPRTRGRAEGRTVSAIAAQELARADLASHSH